VARNEALDGDPALVNSDPYGEGWLFDVRLKDAAEVDDLLSASQYEQQVG
jgi:glycine cleavage system H protein